MFFGMARQLTPLLALHLAQQRLKQEQSRSVLDQVNPNRHDDPLLAQLSKPTTQPEIESFPWSRSYQAEEGPSLYDARGKPVRTVYSQLGLPKMYGNAATAYGQAVQVEPSDAIGSLTLQAHPGPPVGFTHQGVGVSHPQFAVRSEYSPRSTPSLLMSAGANQRERLAEVAAMPIAKAARMVPTSPIAGGVPRFALSAQESFDRAQERGIAERIERQTGRDADATYREMNGEGAQGPTVLTPVHTELMNLSRRYRPAPGTQEWTTVDAGFYRLGRDIFPFKDQWVRGYREAIIAAARRYDLPPALLAGAAYNEVGGWPLWVDRAAYMSRQGRRADRTSFGNLSIQLRTAFDALGYSVAGPWQRRAIISSLEDPITSIFIAARVLSNLRDREFRGTSANRLTREQIEIVGARYNVGPSVPRSRLNRDYGRDITKRWSHLNNLLRGR